MKKTIALVIASLAAACSSSEKPLEITYGAPTTPGYAEQQAIANAELSLQGGAATTDPSTGGPGLAEQLSADLGGSTMTGKASGPLAAKLASGVARSAYDFDPTCVTTSAPAADGTVTMTWGAATPCVATVPAGLMSGTVGITGTLTWNDTTGKSHWSISETVEGTITMFDPPVPMSGTVALDGDMTVGASTIDVTSGSDSNITVVFDGQRIPTHTVTTLVAHLGYETDPAFCFTSGSLRLEQRIESMGDRQGEGWDFVWGPNGCGDYTVAYGTGH